MGQPTREYLRDVGIWITSFIPAAYAMFMPGFHLPAITWFPLVLWPVLVAFMGRSQSVGMAWKLMLGLAIVATWVAPVAVMWLFILLEGRDEFLQGSHGRFLFWALFGTSLAAAGVAWLWHGDPFSEIALAFVWLAYSERLARGRVEREWHRQQAERALATRISTEMHDHLGNKLTLVALMLRRMRSDDVKAPVDDALNLVMAAIVDVQSLAAGLGAPRRWPEDLEATIDLVRNQTGLAVECSGPWNEVVHSRDQSLLLRAVREGLSNVMRHTKQATTCRITLEKVDTSWNVMVEDDGAPSLTVMPGFGLSALREALNCSGGRLLVEASALGGIALQAQIPLREGQGLG